MAEEFLEPSRKPLVPVKEECDLVQLDMTSINTDADGAETMELIKPKPQQNIFVAERPLIETDAKPKKKKKELSQKQVEHLERIRLKSVEAKKNKKLLKEAEQKEKEDALIEKRLRDADDKVKKELLMKPQLERTSAVAYEEPPKQPPPPQVKAVIDYDKIDEMMNQKLNKHFEAFEKRDDAKKALIMENLRKEADKKQKSRNFMSSLSADNFHCD